MGAPNRPRAPCNQYVNINLPHTPTTLFRAPARRFAEPVAPTPPPPSPAQIFYPRVDMASVLSTTAIPQPACTPGACVVWGSMDLDLDPARQTYSSLTAEVLGELVEDDLKARAKQPEPGYKRLSDRHQAVARYVAQGLSNNEIAILTGYTTQTITILKGDRTFQELVSFYKDNIDVQLADLRLHLSGLSIDAIVELRERLETNPEKISMTSLMEMIKMSADRTGHGPASSQQLNVSVNIASRLEAARRRVQDKIIDITPKEIEDGSS